MPKLHNAQGLLQSTSARVSLHTAMCRYHSCQSGSSHMARRDESYNKKEVLVQKSVRRSQRIQNATGLTPNHKTERKTEDTPTCTSSLHLRTADQRNQWLSIAWESASFPPRPLTQLLLTQLAERAMSATRGRANRSQPVMYCKQDATANSRSDESDTPHTSTCKNTETWHVSFGGRGVRACGSCNE